MKERYSLRYKKKRRYFFYKGKSLTLTEWAKEVGMNINTLYKRVHVLRHSFEQALLTETYKKVDRTSFTFPTELMTETLENRIMIPKTICSYFGCPKELSLQEKRFGDRCIRHQKQNLKIA